MTTKHDGFLYPNVWRFHSIHGDGSQSWPVNEEPAPQLLIQWSPVICYTTFLRQCSLEVRPVTSWAQLVSLALSASQALSRRNDNGLKMTSRRGFYRHLLLLVCSRHCRLLLILLAAFPHRWVRILWSITHTKKTVRLQRAIPPSLASETAVSWPRYYILNKSSIK